MDEIDAFVNRRKKQTKLFFGLAAAAFIVGLIALQFTAWVGVPVLLLFGGLLYAGIINVRHTPELGGRVQLVKGLAAILANDAALKAPATIWMCFDQKGTTLSEAPWPAKKRGKERHSTCEWLRLETTLLDGTELSQTITDFFRDRTYVNPRGKSKKKRRVTSVVTQKYKFVSDVYGDPAGFSEQIRQLVRLPHSATLRDLRIGAKTLTAKIQVKATTDLLPACTGLSLGAYRILNLSRLVGKGAK
jgi:hypothetical protein